MTNDKQRLLLLSAYHTDSHRYWCEGLIEHLPSYEWDLKALPGRFFSWRLRGNPLSWLHEEFSGYDAAIVTSMVDWATLKGLHSDLARLPSLVYFHENQFAYPWQSGQQGQLEAQMVSIYAALAADQLVFNSEYNRQGFLQGAQALLDKFPDLVPQGVIERFERRSCVLPVPLRSVAECFKVGMDRPQKLKPLKLVWNHRWEYDKGPERLLELCRGLQQQNIDFRLLLLGKRFRQVPEAMQQLLAEFSDRVVVPNYLSDHQEYLHFLSSADIVMSTAHHEFQGLAVMEAVQLGLTPLVPDSLSYPEYYPSAFRYQSVDQAVQLLKQWYVSGVPSPPKVSYAWHDLLPMYQQQLTSLLSKLS